MTTPQRSGTTALGVVLVVCAGIMLASMDSIGKYLSSSRLHVLQVVWARYVVHTLLVFGWLVVSRGDIDFLRSRRPLTQFVRSLTLLGVTGCMYAALVYVPLANATAVLFFAPVLVTVLAGIFLGETVGRHRLAAVVTGFVGVVLIVRPGFSTDWHMLLPLGAALMLSFYLLMTRYISAYDYRQSTYFYSTAFGAVALSCLVPWYWQAPEPTMAVLMLAMGALGALGHGCIVLGFAQTPASILSPFLYSQLLAAAVLSLAIFGDPLDWPTVAGAALLVGGGLVIWWWESVLARRTRP